MWTCTYKEFNCWPTPVITQATDRTFQRRICMLKKARILELLSINYQCFCNSNQHCHIYDSLFRGKLLSQPTVKWTSFQGFLLKKTGIINTNPKREQMFWQSSLASSMSRRCRFSESSPEQVARLFLWLIIRLFPRYLCRFDFQKPIAFSSY